MKIRILSDLHLEFSEWDPPETDSDVVVLAGDIHKDDRGVKWAKAKFPDKQVIYVPGNHEYYGGSLVNTLHHMKEEAAGSNVHVLDKEEVILDGVQFLGGTFWTDYWLYGNPMMAKIDAWRGMSDFSKIRDRNYSRVKPDDFEFEHFTMKQFIRKKLEEKFTGKTVVITHHAPSERSIAPRYKDPASAYYHLNPSFSSHAEACMSAGDKKVDLWIHGHLHNISDYVVEEQGTRVVCNPRGYQQHGYHEETGFNPRLIIEV